MAATKNIKTGKIEYSMRTETGASYSPVFSDHWIICNRPTAMIINLPPVANSSGIEFEISNINIGQVIVDGNGSELINTSLTQVINQWETLNIRCNGTIWIIL